MKATVSVFIAGMVMATAIGLLLAEFVWAPLLGHDASSAAGMVTGWTLASIVIVVAIKAGSPHR